MTEFDTPGRGRRCCEGGGGGGRGARGWGSLLEPAILAVLASAGTHGYDLRRSVEELTGRAVCVDPGGTYRVLRRLEDGGFLTSAWAGGERGPQRREYELTEAGHALMHKWRDHLAERERAFQAVIAAIDDAEAPDYRQEGHDDE